ncbi:hypothetical protein Efla_002715 [Eimeria flavescens]
MVCRFMPLRGPPPGAPRPPAQLSTCTGAALFVHKGPAARLHPSCMHAARTEASAADTGASGIRTAAPPGLLAQAAPNACWVKAAAASSGPCCNWRLEHAAPATQAAASWPAVASVAALLPLDAPRGEQQALQSLLRELEGYSSNPNTKLSLKVYHLQQLAAVRGCSYLLLQQHPGFARLIGDLTAAAAAAASELSAQQLHALALCCCRLRLPAAHPLWNGMAKQMLRHTKGGGLSVSEASSSLRAFAAAAAAVDSSHLAGLMQHVLRNVGRLNEYDAACLLYAVRSRALHASVRGPRLRASLSAAAAAGGGGDNVPLEEGLQSILCFLSLLRYRFNPRAETEQQLQLVTTAANQGASRSLQGAKSRGPQGAPAFGCAAARAGSSCTAVDSKQTSSRRAKRNGSRSSSNRSSCSSSSNLSKLSLKIVRVAAWVLQQRAAAATPKSLVCCLYEFGLLQLLPWRLLLLLRRRLQQQQLLQQLDGQGLALLALSLALLQQRHRKILRRIGCVLQQQQQPQQEGSGLSAWQQRQPLSNQSLCLLLHAVSRLDNRESSVLQAACQRIEK